MLVVHTKKYVHHCRATEASLGTPPSSVYQYCLSILKLVRPPDASLKSVGVFLVAPGLEPPSHGVGRGLRADVRNKEHEWWVDVPMHMQQP